MSDKLDDFIMWLYHLFEHEPNLEYFTTDTHRPAPYPGMDEADLVEFERFEDSLDV